TPAVTLHQHVSIELVPGPWRRLFVAMLLAICVGAPAIEMFDQWDHTVQDGNDTEMNLVVATLCVGMGVLVARTIVSCARPHRVSISFIVSAPCVPASIDSFLTLSVPTTSPPATLRI